MNVYRTLFRGDFMENTSIIYFILLRSGRNARVR